VLLVVGSLLVAGFALAVTPAAATQSTQPGGPGDTANETQTTFTLPPPNATVQEPTFALPDTKERPSSTVNYSRRGTDRTPPNAPPGAPANWSASNRTVVEDRYEPNDGPSNATGIKYGTYSNLTLTGSESDYFGFRAQSGEKISATGVFQTNSPGYHGILLYSSDHRLLKHSISTENRQQVTYNVPENGTYFVRAYRSIGASAPKQQTSSRYHLSVFGSKNGTLPGNDRFEPNNGFDTAAPVTPDTYYDLKILNGERDVYAVNASRGQTMSVGINFVHSKADLDLAVYGPQGKIITRRSSTSNGESVRVRNLPKTGIYYVKVYGYTAATAPYSMTISRTGDAPQTTVGRSQRTLQSSTFTTPLPQTRAPLTSTRRPTTKSRRTRTVATTTTSRGVITTIPREGQQTTRRTTTRDPFAPEPTTIPMRTTTVSETTATTTLPAVRRNDHLEPNDKGGEPATINPGKYNNLRIVDNENDYYAIQLNTCDELIFETTSRLSRTGSYGLVLYDRQGDTESVATAPYEHKGVSMTARNPGTYYVRVYGYTRNDEMDSSLAYSMSVDRKNTIESLGSVDHISVGDSFDLNGSCIPAYHRSKVSTLQEGIPGIILGGPNAYDGRMWYTVQLSTTDGKQEYWVPAGALDIQEQAFEAGDYVQVTNETTVWKDEDEATLEAGVPGTVIEGPVQFNALRWYKIQTWDGRYWVPQRSLEEHVAEPTNTTDAQRGPGSG
jgi:hypothetical protein